MINAIILSKDKAPQLHLLIESLQRNNPNLFDIRVIYETTNNVYEQGYEKLKTFYSAKDRFGLNFPIKWFERESENLSVDILDHTPDSRDLSCVFNDENIVFDRLASYKKVIKLFRTNQVTALSLRLGNNTVVQNPYSANNFFINKPQEGEFVLDKFLLWDATKIKPYTNFSMPFSHNGHIYTTKMLKFIVNETVIKELDDFEKNLQDNLYMGAFGGLIPPTMACPEYSICINNSAKKVSDTTGSDFGTTDFGLNDRYVNGSIIDYDFFNFTHISKPYQEFITRFKRENHLYYSH